MTNLPNVEAFRRTFLADILAFIEAHGKFTEEGNVKLSSVNAAGAAPVYVNGHTLTFRGVICAKNGFACVNDVRWNCTEDGGIVQDSFDYLVREVRAARPEWFKDVVRVGTRKAAAPLNVLADLGL